MYIREQVRPRVPRRDIKGKASLHAGELGDPLALRDLGHCILYMGGKGKGLGSMGGSIQGVTMYTNTIPQIGC